MTYIVLSGMLNATIPYHTRTKTTVENSALSWQLKVGPFHFRQWITVCKCMVSSGCLSFDTCFHSNSYIRQNTWNITEKPIQDMTSRPRPRPRLRTSRSSPRPRLPVCKWSWGTLRPRKRLKDNNTAQLSWHPGFPTLQASENLVIPRPQPRNHDLELGILRLSKETWVHAKNPYESLLASGTTFGQNWSNAPEKVPTYS